MIDPSTGNLVKICGLMETSSAMTAASCGADMLGFVFAESRRKVGPELVRSVREALENRLDALPALVGVAVNMTASEAVELFHDARLDLLQLSGDESPDILDQLDVPVIKTIHLRDGSTADELSLAIDPWFDHPAPAISILVDAGLPGVYGGSGTQPDWSLASLLAERYPVILAGGLKPGNVADSIRSVRPRGVDVSSGVEIGGSKDSALIGAFLVRARQALQDVSADEKR